MVDTDLRARLDALQAEVDALGARPAARPRRRRRAMTVAAALLAIVAIAVPVGVFANHQFTDVPTSNTFHGSIAKMKIAGITAGCSATKYCPNDAVTRGQMAAFLNRAAGRGSVGADAFILLGGGGTNVGTTVVTTPGAGYILATATGMAYTNDTSGCPCNVALQMQADDAVQSFYLIDTVPNATGVGAGHGSIGNTWIFSVATAGDHTVEILMSQSSGSADVYADATITLLWVPFDGDGDAFSGAPTFTTEGQPQR